MLGRWQGTRNQPYQSYPPYYQQGYGYPPYQGPAQNPSAGTDARLAQLQLLERLRASGVLTEAEFEAEKQRILSGY
ncbi:MAG: SHOCT domain-containing protein [Thermogemmatispora sp.]|nr:SHOCT domain-containing protein [Thermogemmatispora sp.]